MDCVVLRSYGLIKKKRPQRKIQIFIVELPKAAAPYSEIYLTAKHRKQIHSVTLIFQPPAVDITMYICVRVSQEDFFMKAQEVKKLSNHFQSCVLSW